MTQMTESTTAPAQGAYLVDTVAVPGADPYAVAVWTGRVQRVLPDGRLRLISYSGYEWPVAPVDTRPATGAERAVYERGGMTRGTRAPRGEGAVS